MSGMEWIFKIKDMVKGPAASIQKELKGIRGALKEAQGAFKDVGKASEVIGPQVGRFQRFARALSSSFEGASAKAKEITKEATALGASIGTAYKNIRTLSPKEQLKGFAELAKIGGKLSFQAAAASFRAFHSIASTGISKLYSGAKAAYDFISQSQALQKGVEAVKFGAEASETKRLLMSRLTIMERSASEAERIQGLVQKVADATGGSPQEVIASYEILKAKAGYMAEEVQLILAASSDIGAMLGKDKQQKFVDIFAKLKTQVGVQLEDLLDLGIPIETLKEQFGVAQNVSRQQFAAILGSGHKTANEIGDVLTSMTKKLAGSTALGTVTVKKSSGNIFDQMQKMKNAIFDVFADESITRPFAEAMGEINALLGKNTETGKAVRDAIGGAFRAVASVVTELKSQGWIKDLASQLFFVGTLSIRVFSAVVPYVKAFAGPVLAGLMAGLKPIIGVFKELFAKMDGGPNPKIIGVFKAIGFVVGGVVTVIGYLLAGVVKVYAFLGGAVVKVVESVVALFDGVVSIGKKVGEFFSNLFDARWLDVGASFIGAIWGGIKKGFKWVFEQVKGLVNLLPDSVKKLLGIGGAEKAVGRGVDQDIARMKSFASEAVAGKDQAAFDAAMTGPTGPTRVLNSQVRTVATTNNNTFTINAAPGMDTKQLAKDVVDHMGATNNRRGELSATG